MIEYKTIDLNSYPRKAHLEYFMTMEHPQLNITAEIDVTDLKKFCEKEDCSFFLSFIHIVALSADSIPQFRQRIHRLSPDEMQLPEYSGLPKDGPLSGFVVREYSQSPTSHTEDAGNDMYCYCCMYHHMPWKEYIREAERLQLQARACPSLEEDSEIEAFYFPTCVPWIHYSGISHPATDRYDSNPRFSWGKFEEDYRGRLMMPLTVMVHHGLVDGIHLSRFFENVSRNMTALIKGELDYTILTMDVPIN